MINTIAKIVYDLEVAMDDQFEEVDGHWTCQDCGYEYSGMIGDDEVPESCELCYGDMEVL